MMLIRSALESPDPGASNGGSNVQIRHFGIDLDTFEVAGWPQNLLSKENVEENLIENEQSKFMAIIRHTFVVKL